MLELNITHLQEHCRTCLIQLPQESDEQSGIKGAPITQYRIAGPKTNDNLKQWVSNIVGLPSQQLEHSYPQKLCHSCFGMLETCNDICTKVQLTQNLLVCGSWNVEPSNSGHLTCVICLRNFLREVKSFICKVGSSPNLQQWLECANGQQLCSQWFSKIVCFFCYSCLRNCFEWRRATAESDFFIKSILMKDNINCMDWFNEPIKQETIDDIGDFTGEMQSVMFYSDNQYVDLIAPNQIAIKQEIPDYKIEDKYETLINDTSFNDSFNNSLLCLDNTPTTNKTPCNDETSNSPVEKLCLRTLKQHSNMKMACNLCNQRFNKTVLLEAHILHVHQGRDRPFLCKHCSHAYITHTHLKRHVKTIHKEVWLKEQREQNLRKLLNL